MRYYEVFPAGWSLHGIPGVLCNTIPSICDMAPAIVFKEDPQYLDKDRVPVFANHTVAGTSLRAFEHFSQNFNNGGFHYYDYGDGEANMRIYG